MFANVVSKTASILLFTICIWMLARFSFAALEVLSPSKAESPLLANPISNTTKTSHFGANKPDAKNIKHAHLFGEKNTSHPRPVKRAYTPPPKESKLDMKLVGIVSSSDNSKAAVISYQGKQRSYLIGEFIPTSLGEATVVDVLKGHVIIERNNTKEAIKLAKRNIAFDVTSGVRILPPLSIDLSSQPFKELLGEAKKTLRDRPLFLSKFFKVQPVSSDRGFSGYRLNPGADARAFNLLSLKPGDLLTKINGQHISTLSIKSTSLLVEASPQLELTLERNSAPFLLTVSF